MTELFAITGESVAHIVQQGDVWNTNLLLKDSRAHYIALILRGSFKHNHEF
jgi:hypothetical protein